MLVSYKITKYFLFYKMETNDDVNIFLDSFEQFYADYATIDDNFQQYLDVCHTTATALFNILAVDSTNATEITFTHLVQSLIHKKMEANVIICEFGGTYQTHSFVIIPRGDHTIITQSFGGLYAAYSRIYNTTEFVELIESLFTNAASMEKLFSFNVPDDKFQWDQIKVAPRKKMHVDILPDRNLYKNILDKLRSEYLTESDVNFSNYDAAAYKYEIINNYYVLNEVYMTMRPNAYEKIIGMYYYPKNN